jgi:hypothetical protein
LSSLSFADNQHLGVKKNFKMKEGPKDKVILRINLLKPILVKKLIINSFVVHQIVPNTNYTIE